MSDRISWQRWFAWYPVRIGGRWYWLTYVARDQWANKPARYHYGFYLPYLVLEFEKGPTGFGGMQALINEKAAEGYALHQVIERSTYQWVLIFKRDAETEN